MYIRIRVGLFHASSDFARHVWVDGVESLRPVQSNCCDAAVDGVSEGFEVVHGLELRWKEERVRRRASKERGTLVVFETGLHQLDLSTLHNEYSSFQPYKYNDIRIVSVLTLSSCSIAHPITHVPESSSESS